MAMVPATGGRAAARSLGVARINTMPEHKAWVNMRYRCFCPSAPDFVDYGNRGITVCERWNSFENFYRDMGPRPEGQELDRIDNDGSYCPDNCKWSTRSEQNLNRRNRRMLTARGETLNLAVWGRRIGVRVETVRDRIKRGWSHEEAIFGRSAMN